MSEYVHTVNGRHAVLDDDEWEGVEYTGPVGRVMRVAGHDARGARPGEIVHPPGARIEYTTPGGYVTAVAGRPRTPTQYTPRPDNSENDERAARYELAQRRHDLRMARLANPDLRLFGIAVPYDRILPDPARGDRLLFTRQTVWDSDRYPPVRLDHGPRPLAAGTLAELDDGLYVDATIGGPLRKMIGDRRQLSVAISNVRTRPRPGGVLEVEACRLDEVSLCRRAVWQPLTNCTLTPLAA